MNLKSLSLFVFFGLSHVLSHALVQTFTTKEDFERGNYQDVLISDGFDGEVTLEPKISGLKKSGFTEVNRILFGNVHSFGLINYGNRIIVLGGKTQADSPVDTVLAANIEVGGVIREVNPLRKLPQPMANHGTVLIGRNVYIISSDGSQKVYRSTLDDAGELSPWKEELRIPFKIFTSKAVSFENRIYLFSTSGDGRILVGNMNLLGDIISWTEIENKIDVVNGFSIYAYHGKIFLSGGIDKFSSIRRDVYIISINPDGTLGSYSIVSKLPYGLSNHAMVVKGNTAFISGGFNGFSATRGILVGKIENNNSIGNWELVQELPKDVSDHAVLVNRKYFLSIGGKKLSFDSDLSINQLEYESQPSPVRTEQAAPLTDSGLIAIEGRMYAIGGRLGAFPTQNVYASAIDGNGVIGVFNKMQDLPKKILPKNLQFINGRIYMIGSGITGDVPLFSIRSVKVESSGQLSDYRIERDLPTTFSYIGSVSYKNFIYVMRDGGGTDQIIRTQVQQDGTLSDFIPQSNSPATLVHTPALAIRNNRIYFYGASSGLIFQQNSIYSAEIDPAGNIGMWRKEKEVPFDRETKGQMRVVGNHLYLTGGYRTASDGTWNPTIYSVPLNDDGSLGSWQNLGSAPGNPYGEYDTTDWNGRFYFGMLNTTGGNKIASAGQPTYTSGVYYSPIYDLSTPRNINSISWKKEINPEGSKLSLSFSCGNSTSTTMGPFELKINGSQLENLTCRYIQYRVDLDVGPTSKEVPTLEEVTFVHEPDFIDERNIPQIAISSVTSDTISISLVDHSLGEDQFVVSVATDQNPSNEFKTVTTVINKSSQTLFITLDGLKPSREYFIRARAFNVGENLFGPYSNELSTTTRIRIITVPSAHTVTSNQFELMWSTMAEVSCFKIFNHNNELLSVLSSTETSYTETNFAQNDKVIRIVMACNNETDALIKRFEFYSGMEPPSQDQIKILDRGDTWVHLAIKAPVNPEFEKTAAIISVSREGSLVPEKEIKLVSPEFTVRLDNLAYGQSYQFSGAYVNGDGVIFRSSLPSLTERFGLANENVGVQNTKFIIFQGIDFQFNSNSPVVGSIKIYNVNQELIRELSVNVPSGPTTVYWDGKDSDGRYVHTDVYWAIIETNVFGKRRIYVAGIR